MIRVMMVLEAADGGVGRHVRSVSAGLCRAGVELHIVYSARRNPAYGRGLEPLRLRGVAVTELDMRCAIEPRHDLTAAWRLRRLMGRVRPDVIHLHSSKAGALGRMAAAGGGLAPIVYTPHAYAFLDDERGARCRAYRLAERALARFTDHLVAVSPSEAAASLTHRLVGEGQVTVVPNGVDPMPDLDTRRAGEGPVRLGFVGRFERQKHPQALLRAGRVLRHLGIDHRLTLVGDGSERRDCQRLCARLGIGEHVQLTGHLADPSRLYRNIDIYVCASRYEGLPYAVLDAMSWGLPVVGFDVAGMDDLVLHGATGLLAPPRDVGALAAHIARLAGDTALRRRFGEAGRRRVERDFRLGAQIHRLKRVYADVSDARRGQRS